MPASGPDRRLVVTAFPHRMRLLQIGVALGAAATVSACCGSDYASAALAVTIVDAGTGRPAGAGATVVVEGTGGRDSTLLAADPAAGQPAYVGFEPTLRAGRYAVTVRKPGYLPWVRTGIEVDDDRCGHPRRRSLTATLSPAPA